MSETNSYMVFSGTATKYLAEKMKICQSLGCPLGQLLITKFSDGEFAVSYEESIRGRDVFLVQSTFPSSDNLMELLLMIDAAKRASARTINAVIPYFGWARQDRKDKPRVSIGAKLVADLLSVAGVNRVITMDLHADQIQGFFDVPVDHLYASGVIIPYLESLHLEDLVIASPDVGGSKRANTYAKYFGCPLVLCNKTRARANVVATMQIIGEVEGKNVVIIDDMVDTAGTITKAADLMKANGAKTVRACASHCVMSGPASDRVQASALEEIVFTDSIPYTQRCAKVKQLSVAETFAEAIRRLSCQSNVYQIRGFAHDFTDGDTICLRFECDEERPVLITQVADGKFTFSGETDATTLCHIYHKNIPESTVSFFLEPSEITVELSLLLERNRVSGTTINNSWQQLNDSIWILGQEVVKTSLLPVTDSVTQLLRVKATDSLHRRMSDCILNTARRNSGNPLGQYINQNYKAPEFK